MDGSGVPHLRPQSEQSESVFARAKLLADTDSLPGERLPANGTRAPRILPVILRDTTTGT